MKSGVILTSREPNIFTMLFSIKNQKIIETQHRNNNIGFIMKTDGDYALIIRDSDNRSSQIIVKDHCKGIPSRQKMCRVIFICFLCFPTFLPLFRWLEYKKSAQKWFE